MKPWAFVVLLGGAVIGGAAAWCVGKLADARPADFQTTQQPKVEPSTPPETAGSIWASARRRDVAQSRQEVLPAQHLASPQVVASDVPQTPAGVNIVEPSVPRRLPKIPESQVKSLLVFTEPSEESADATLILPGVENAVDRVGYSTQHTVKPKAAAAPRRFRATHDDESEAVPKHLVLPADAPTQPEPVHTRQTRPNVGPASLTDAETTAQSGFPKTNVLVLNHRPAREISEQVRAWCGDRITSVAVDERSNAIIVNAPAKLFADVRKAVSALDRPSRPDGRMTQVVPLKYADPTEVQRAIARLLAADAASSN